MRWKGLIFLATLVAIFIALSMFFIDKWIESGLEKAAQAIVGARVEIDNLDFSLTGLSIKWDRLQVTDPNNTMRNLIETGRTAFKMNAPALFRKRYIIEEMTLVDVRTGTSRKYDGALPKTLKKKKTKPDVIDKVKHRLNKEIDKLPVMNFNLDAIKRKLNLDSLIVMADLKMVKRLDSAKTDIIQTSKKWEAFYRDFHPDEDLKKIRADFANIDPKQIKTIPELISTLEKVKSAQKTLNMLSETVTVRYKEIHTDFDQISTYAKNVNDWFNEDYHNILAKAKIPDLTVRDIGKILFGGTIVKQVTRYLEYLQMIRKHIPKKAKESEKKKQRMAGQTIHFPDRYGWPEFLIKKIHLSGQTGTTVKQPGLVMSGNVVGITSQPWIYGKPTVINLKAIQENKLSGIFAAVLDHTTEISSDSFNIHFKNVSLNNVKIHKTPYLPSKIRRGKADFNSLVRFENETILAQINIKARDLDFDFRQVQTDNKFVEIVQEVINSIKVLTLDTKISSEGDNLDFKMDSNLDELVSRKLKGIGTKALTDAKNKIRTRLDEIRNKKLAEVDKIFNVKRNEIVEKIDTHKERVDQEKAKIENKIKEIQEDINKRKKKEENKLKEKAKELLDGILK